MKKIGIWGLGVGGTSVIRYFLAQGYKNLGVYDKRPLNESERAFLAANEIALFDIKELDEFLSSYDFIIPSAGIDLRPYTHYEHKWISEVDLFAQAHKNPLIAITGTLGKTTVTHLLSHLLNSAGLSVASGGNIGIGMLDLAEMKTDYTVLELSSFQLDITKKLAPDLAVITNVYPNHLDRHGTMQAYIDAKYALIKNQSKNQKALIHADLYPLIKARNPRAELRIFSESKPHFDSEHSYYFENDHTIIFEQRGNKKEYPSTCQQIPIHLIGSPLLLLLIYLSSTFLT